MNHIALTRTFALGAALTATLLAGCSTIVPVDSEVKSYLGQAGAPVKGGSFRFERLPSQQVDAAQANKMEAMAQPALEKAGFRRDDANAQYSVQLGAYSAQQIDLPASFNGPWPRYVYPAYYGRFFYYHRPLGYRTTVPLDPMYVSAVTVVVREMGTGRVVYETNATNEQRWFDPDKVFPPMFEAAMKDYPNAPTAPRTITISVDTAKK